jgi:uncharacterized protein YecE (DUF72 family)
MNAFIGTAGWGIPRESRERFAGEGTHLERYGRVLPCAEINSSFYRPHARATYAKWAASTPASFRFAVKVPKLITHERALRRARQPLERFLWETAGLGKKRGPLLVQLPPSQHFNRSVAAAFFQLFRSLHRGPIVCEPRHESWFGAAASMLFVSKRIARVAADPAEIPGAGQPGGWTGFVYYRLHGSPRMYWSRYSEDYLQSLKRTLEQVPPRVPRWCIFDNTASGAALDNAWTLSHMEAEMPFKSKAQRRKFAALLVEGKISDKTFEEWNRETGSKKLPERVKPKAGARKK